ncbi:MAG: hypothetical protein JNM88_08620 [Chitinophagaceae bacterium]|nr:hypothetical protein [Chitinophagaceae bacterium]
MKKAAFLFSAIMVLVVIVSTQSCQSTKSGTASKLLRFNYENGKGYDYEMSMELNQVVMGQRVPTTVQYYYSMDVAPGNEGTKAISTTFERLKMEVSVGAYSMIIDSDKPETKPDEDNPMSVVENKMNTLMRSVKGRKFTMIVDDAGDVKEVTGFEGMAEVMADSLGLAEEQKAELVKNFKDQFNKDEVKSQFAQVLYIFPNKEVKVGDSWEKEYGSGKQLGNGKFISTYTVKEIEGDIVTLEERSKLMEGNGERTMKGKKSGIITVDSKTGLVVDAEHELDMIATINGKEMEIKGAIKIKGKARG